MSTPLPTTAVEIQSAVRSGACSATSIADAHVARIEALEPQLHAWQAFDPALARSQAAAIDAQLAQGRLLGPLAGVPIGVKDLFDSVHWPTTYGSPVYASHRPVRDAAALRIVQAAGAVPFGKTVTTEFGYFRPGPTANPRRPTHTPGGSSSGSAAAVAAGMVPLAFGTQTAGSLIRPASYCGVWALKPTHGVFSLDGVKGLSHSLDTLGWLANDADDLELLRCALAGDHYSALPRRGRLHLASWATFEAPLLDASGIAVWQQAQQRLGEHHAISASLAVPPSFEQLFDAQKTVMAYEAARSLATELQQHRAQLSEPLQLLLDTGHGVSDDAYRAAQALTAQGREWFTHALHEVDALVVPAAPGEAPEGLAATGDPAFSRVWNLLGLPCVNVPGLLGPGGLPVGVQLVGRAGQERALLATARRVAEAFAPA